MASNEHLIFSRETTWGTWVTPTLALPVRSVTVQPESPLMIDNSTGGGRGTRDGGPGEVGVAGDIVCAAYPTIIGKLLRAGFGARIATTLPTITITSNSIANPTVITTSAPHGLAVGQSVTISGSTGSTPAINGTQIVTGVLSPTTFTVAVNVTVAGTGGTIAAGFRNKMLPDDDLPVDSFSMQKRYKTTVGESIRGAKLSGWTLAARAREFAELTMNYVAKDATINGSVWSDGTTAPAVVTPVTYPSFVGEAYKFYQGSLTLGGSVALTAGELIVTGGVAKVDFDNIEVEVNYNIGTDAYGVNLGDRTIQSADEGRREVMFRFDPNFDTSPSEFYTAWRAGTPGVLRLALTYGNVVGTGNAYEMIVTLPQVRYSTGSLPELNAEYGLKRFTVEGQALVHPVHLQDIGLVIQSTESYAV